MPPAAQCSKIEKIVQYNIFIFSQLVQKQSTTYQALIKSTYLLPIKSQIALFSDFRALCPGPALDPPGLDLQ